MESLNLSYHHPGSKLLVVDDEPNIRMSLAQALILEGYEADAVASGEEALARLNQTPYNLMILDMSMPGMGGVAVMKVARKIQPDLLIVVLTGHASLDNAIASVRFHATDYLQKPVSVRDMVHCVNEALQRNRQKRQQQYLLDIIGEAVDTIRQKGRIAETPLKISSERFIRVSPLTLDCRKRVIALDDSPAVLQLTGGETLVLRCLMMYPDRLFSCSELAYTVWEYTLDEQSAQNMVRPHISRLRRKIESLVSESQLICTVRGQGYFFASGDASSKSEPSVSA